MNKASDGLEETPTKPEKQKPLMKSTLSFDQSDPNEIKLAPPMSTDSEVDTKGQSGHSVDTRERHVSLVDNRQESIKRADSISTGPNVSAFRSAILSTMASLSTTSDSSSQAGQGAKEPQGVSSGTMANVSAMVSALKAINSANEEDLFAQSTVASVKDWYANQMDCNSSDED